MKQICRLRLQVVFLLTNVQGALMTLDCFVQAILRFIHLPEVGQGPRQADRVFGFLRNRETIFMALKRRGQQADSLVRASQA